LRTVEEIKEHIRKIEEMDLFGTRIDLVSYLSFNEAKEFLKPDSKEEDWKATELTEKAILKEMKEYMIFALGKVENHRGISAGRSIDHFHNWLFLLGDDELLKFLDDDSNYANYGAPILKKICEKYDIPFPKGKEFNRMAEGKPCYEGCQEGCGR